MDSVTSSSARDSVDAGTGTDAAAPAAAAAAVSGETPGIGASSSGAAASTSTTGVGASGDGAAAAGVEPDAIPGRPRGQRFNVDQARSGFAGGAAAAAAAAAGGGRVDPRGFFGPGAAPRGPANPWDPHGPPMGGTGGNFAFTAGFGFFPSLFGLSFQTFGLGSGIGGSGGAGTGGAGGDARREQLTPEERQQMLLSNVLLVIGCLVILILMFL